MVGTRNVFFSFVFIAFGGLLFGYIIGINGNVVTTGQLLCKKDWEGVVGSWTSVGYRQCYNLSPITIGTLSSLNLIGACISSMFCFRYADNIGRKAEVQIGAALYLLGAGIASFSPVLWGIFVGFTIYGLGIGFAMHAAPVFIAEIAPAEIRGSMVSAKEGIIVFGIFFGFFFGYVFSGIEYNGWRLMVAISALFALIMEVGITFVPQSPRFLVLKATQVNALLGSSENSFAEARRALQFFRQADNPEQVQGELDLMITDIAAAVGDSQQTAGCADAFEYPRPLLIGCGLVLLQQITGQPSVLYFATNIFKSAGFGSASALSSVGVGLVKLLATLFTVSRVDTLGRRVALFYGITMMTFALMVVAIAFLFRECQTSGISLSDCDAEDVGLPFAWALIAVAGLMLYVSGYQVGFGPISWLIISEIFPIRVRGAAMSLAALVNFGSNILVTLTQASLLNLLTPSGVFFTYLAFAVVSFIFVWKIVPETKGKTLEQIEAMIGVRKTQARSTQVASHA